MVTHINDNWKERILGDLRNSLDTILVFLGFFGKRAI